MNPLEAQRVTWDGVTEDEKQFIGNEWYLGLEERIVNLGSNGIPDKIFVFAGMNDILSQGEVVCMIPYHTIYSAALPVLLEDTEKEAAIISMMRMAEWCVTAG